MCTLKEYIDKYKNGVRTIQKMISVIMKIDRELYDSLFRESSHNIDGYTINVYYNENESSFKIISLLSYGDVEVTLTKEGNNFVGYIITDDPHTTIQSRSVDFDWIDD